MTQYTMLDKCRKVKQEFECTFFVRPIEILMTKEDRDALFEEQKEFLRYDVKQLDRVDEEVFGMRIVIIDSYGPQARAGL